LEVRDPLLQVHTKIYVLIPAVEQEKEEVEMDWPFTWETIGSNREDCFGLESSR
jgi:hypothetical protein